MSTKFNCSQAINYHCWLLTVDCWLFNGLYLLFIFQQSSSQSTNSLRDAVTRLTTQESCAIAMGRSSSTSKGRFVEQWQGISSCCKRWYMLHRSVFLMPTGWTIGWFGGLDFMFLKENNFHLFFAKPRVHPSLGNSNCLYTSFKAYISSVQYTA